MYYIPDDGNTPSEWRSQVPTPLGTQANHRLQACSEEQQESFFVRTFGRFAPSRAHSEPRYARLPSLPFGISRSAATRQGER